MQCKVCLPVTSLLLYCVFPGNATEIQNGWRNIMQITDVKVRKVFSDADPMKAIVSVTLDGQLALHDIKVINTRDKLFIVMPSRKNPDGTYRDIVHPINADFRAELEAAVLKAYDEALAEGELISEE